MKPSEVERFTAVLSQAPWQVARTIGRPIIQRPSSSTAKDIDDIDHGGKEASYIESVGGVMTSRKLVANSAPRSAVAAKAVFFGVSVTFHATTPPRGTVGGDFTLLCFCLLSLPTLVLWLTFTIKPSSNCEVNQSRHLEAIGKYYRSK